MSGREILCVGGPWDGDRIRVSEATFRSGQFKVLADRQEYNRDINTVTYFIHRIAVFNGNDQFIAGATAESPIAELIAGYQPSHARHPQSCSN